MSVEKKRSFFLYRYDQMRKKDGKLSRGRRKEFFYTKVFFPLKNKSIEKKEKMRD